MIDSKMQQILDSITNLPMNWHDCGSVDSSVLSAIINHANKMGTIYHSIETGSGKTTLLFSHLSQNHTVFAKDCGRSISQVKNSPLFNARSTVFIEGPTQRTLPIYVFINQNQLVFLDGPHGYPFPDLEYYYLYPTIAPGGLLIIDDLCIPSIGRMFEIIKADDMFDLIEVINGNTAFLRRTSSPMIDPDGDNWWLQGFNRGYYNEIKEKRPTGKLAFFLRTLSRIIPKQVKPYLPTNLKHKLHQHM